MSTGKSWSILCRLIEEDISLCHLEILLKWIERRELLMLPMESGGQSWMKAEKAVVALYNFVSSKRTLSFLASIQSLEEIRKKIPFHRRLDNILARWIQVFVVMRCVRRRWQTASLYSNSIKVVSSCQLLLDSEERRAQSTEWQQSADWTKAAAVAATSCLSGFLLPQILQEKPRNFVQLQRWSNAATRGQKTRTTKGKPRQSSAFANNSTSSFQIFLWRK